MAGFNKTKKTGYAPERNPVRNHEGAKAHGLNPLEVLFSKVLGSFFGESTFYEKRSAENEFKDLVKTISQIDENDKEYALKIAELGRRFNMIQFPLEVLVACMNDERFKGELFLDRSGKSKFSYYTDVIVRRTKDILDMLATQIAAYGFTAKRRTKRKGNEPKNKRDIPFPTSMRKYLKAKIESYDEYKLSKGLGEGSAVSLSDAIKLLRPKPKNDFMAKLYKRIMEGDLKFGGEKKQVTSELAKKGQGKSTNADIKESLDSSTVMAIVKNLVALNKAGVFNDREAVKSICEKLTNPKEVKNSKLLPFRFYSAWKELRQQRSGYAVNSICDALVTALDLSIENLDVIEGFNAILIDVSGSMDSAVSGNSSVTAKDIALILGAIAYKRGIGDVYIFASSCKKVEGISTKTTVIDLVEKFKMYGVGGGTDLRNALMVLTRQAQLGEKYDNLIVLSDNDAYGYNERSNSLSFSSADMQLTSMLKDKIVKRLWINNLLGNKFAIANTDDYRKNLITGFSEKFINIINVYNGLGMNKDIRKVIDEMLKKEKGR